MCINQTTFRVLYQFRQAKFAYDVAIYFELETVFPSCV
jgi:hypothetical protein